MTRQIPSIPKPKNNRLMIIYGRKAPVKRMLVEKNKRCKSRTKERKERKSKRCRVVKKRREKKERKKNGKKGKKRKNII